ncbi:hypothetical protein MKX03_013503 [Papaver bracteatum]|nr:hypothetical protein MKX03_013503 [Papaver bracteatum]
MLQDETHLLWYSGKKERRLGLDSVTKILIGQRTVNFQRQPLPEKECQSFSLIYADVADLAIHNDIIEKKGDTSLISEYQTSFPSGSTSQSQPFPPTKCDDVLKDILIWGEGITGGYLGGAVDKIGNGNCARTDSLLPKLLESTENLDIKNISFGGKHAALITRQGEVFCWGHEKGGRLGHKVDIDVFYPKIVETLNGVHVESVACGEYTTCALTHSGELYTWGVNCVGGDLLENSGTFGVLGHGNLLSASQPKKVEYLKGLWVKSVACGPWHMAAVVDFNFHASNPNSSGGKLFTWGDGDKGKLGHLDRGRKTIPTCVARLMHYDFVQVSCGRMLTVGLMNTGKVCTIGTAANVQLGYPQARDEPITIIEGKLNGEFVMGVSSGSYHTAVLTSKGKVFTWGKGANGQLGLGDTEDRNSPTLVEALRERQVESIICGSNFTAAICVHKSIFSTHQSSCSGCRIVFRFTRKKYNCYNCGFAFCRVCCNKKVINASLAPNNNKHHRVCSSSYAKLIK